MPLEGVAPIRGHRRVVGLIASALILRHALQHEDGGYRRAGLGVVGGFMLWWGLTDIGGVRIVTLYAAVFTAAGATLVAAPVWGVISPEANPTSMVAG